MNTGKRLYPTLKEERAVRELKKQLGIVGSGIARGGSKPDESSKQNDRSKERKLQD